MAQGSALDKQAVHEDLERVRQDFHQLLDAADREDLTRSSNGTRWNNEQLLFHMLFGYLIVWALLGLARVFARMPAGVSKAYAGLLNAATRPFDVVNYLGPCMAVHVYGQRRMAAKLDRVLASVQRRLDRQSVAELGRGMHYPTRWDPFFRDFMTMADIYRYPTQHYDFHRRQLTLDLSRSTSPSGTP